MLKEVKSFFQNKRVLITGHTGFKGSWLSLMLVSLGAKVDGFSLPLKTQDYPFFRLIHSSDWGDSYFGDVRDLNAIHQAIEQSQPEIIFHLAAQPLVRKSYEAPIETLHINVLGTAHVLSAALQCDSVKILVNVTTDKCYENQEHDWPFCETDRLGGKDIYSASKAASEIISAAYRHSFFQQQGKSLVTARAGNVIGGGDFAESRLLPDLVRAIEKNQSVVLRHPSAIRPWQFVLEPLFGYLLLARSVAAPSKCKLSAVNFAPDLQTQENIDVHSLTLQLMTELRYEQHFVDVQPGEFAEAHTLKLDNRLARDQLGWKPLLTSQEMVRWTCEWYCCYLKKIDSIVNFTHQQINDYLQKVEQDYPVV